MSSNFWAITGLLEETKAKLYTGDWNQDKSKLDIRNGKSSTAFPNIWLGMERDNLVMIVQGQVYEMLIEIA